MLRPIENSGVSDINSEGRCEGVIGEGPSSSEATTRSKRATLLSQFWSQAAPGNPSTIAEWGLATWVVSARSSGSAWEAVRGT